MSSKSLCGPLQQTQGAGTPGWRSSSTAGRVTKRRDGTSKQVRVPAQEVRVGFGELSRLATVDLKEAVKAADHSRQ
jgi:hypothetical protein